MSLRKSPRRTGALLAANRRNSRKSTGPRTFEGKWHSSGNAVRHYRRTRFASCIPIENRESTAFEDFLFKLREAIIPADNARGTETVLLKAAEVWRVKRSFDRWIETRTEEDWLVLAAGAVPPPRSWRLKLRRPGLSVPDWVVTASVCLRWGRGPGQNGGQSGAQGGRRLRRSATEDDERPDRLRLHTVVSVHTTGPFRSAKPAKALEGEPTELESERTKPESVTIQSGSESISVGGCRCPVVGGERDGRQGKLQPDPKTDYREPKTERRTKPESATIQSRFVNMSDPRFSDPTYAEAYALAERIVGWLMGWGKRTKPEPLRNQKICKNMSSAGERAAGNPNGSGRATSLRTTLGKVFRFMKAALVPRKEYRQLPLFQTNPECSGKQGRYKNMSKALGRLARSESCVTPHGVVARRL
jgi:hypothetical protein